MSDVAFLCNSQPTNEVESPDLGAFHIVFRALEEFQPRNFIPHYPVAAIVTPTASVPTTFSPTEESESDLYNRGSTVWTQQPIASYLSISSRTATTRLSATSQSSPAPSPPPSELPSSDTEGEIMIDQEVDSGDYEDDDANNAGEELPSLGLDEALQFIAAERAKLTAPRNNNNSWQQGNSSTSDNPSTRHQHQQHIYQQLIPRRRPRKRKAKSIVVRESSGAAGDDRQKAPADTLEAEPEAEDPSDLSSPDLSSSEAAIRFRSTPASPRRKNGRRNSVRSVSADGRPRLGHSRSTPSLRPGPLDPRVVRLRALAIKLKFLFAAEAELLNAVLSNESLLSSSPDFIDPRGPTPSLGQPLVHVFID